MKKETDQPKMKLNAYQMAGIVLITFSLLGFLRVEADRITTLEYEQQATEKSLVLILARLETIDGKLDAIHDSLAFNRGRDSVK